MNIKLIKRATQCLGLLCILAAMLAGCSSLPATVTSSGVPAVTAASGAYWPTEDWRSSTPEAQGMEAGKLAEMLDAIQEQHLNLHSLLVIRNGYLVSETYFGSYQQDTRHETYSVTKSFVATLIGMAIDKGYIDGVEHRIVDFFPERTLANLDEQKEAMTLNDVLTMRSGLDWQEGEAAYGAMYRSPDWVQFMLDKPMVWPPGSQFNYCSGCSHLLSAILQQTTGMNTRDFAEEYLFEPMGVSNAVWDTDGAGIPIGGWGLQMTPREMAKLGHLYLHHGEWEGQQIVSASWVEEATKEHTQAEDEWGYGYQWWTYPPLGTYAAWGLYGQTIFVIPESDLVVVTTAEMDNDDEITELVEKYIVPAVRE
ncbi:MAG: serine hydrolase [Anaerolineales bacterium]|jgi:CubicO group peptidase (beta-lactamase class C family)